VYRKKYEKAARGKKKLTVLITELVRPRKPEFLVFVTLSLEHFNNNVGTKETLRL
jgi:hypothetical protein